MDRGILNYVVDMSLALAFILSFFTGILKWPGLIGKFGLSYSDLPMAAITKIHDLSGLAMGLLVLIHLILHWKWIVCFTKKILGRKDINANTEGNNNGKNQN
jgi:hypothetical protein